MAQVTDYTTGKLLTMIKQAFSIFESAKGQLSGSETGKRLLKEIKKLDPILTNRDGASKFIQESNKCAVGERVCKVLHKNSEFTEEVFLDELAEGMVKAEKAKYVTKENAINTLKKYPKNPLIISKVSGKHMEICRSCPDVCVYWNMEKRGLKCLNR
jgi:hypothetical protein